MLPGQLRHATRRHRSSTRRLVQQRQNQRRGCTCISQRPAGRRLKQLLKRMASSGVGMTAGSSGRNTAMRQLVSTPPKKKAKVTALHSRQLRQIRKTGEACKPAPFLACMLMCTAWYADLLCVIPQCTLLMLTCALQCNTDGTKTLPTGLHRLCRTAWHEPFQFHVSKRPPNIQTFCVVRSVQTSEHLVEPKCTLVMNPSELSATPLHSVARVI